MAVSKQSPRSRSGADDDRAEPASFRDPSNRVFYAGGEVLRGLRGPAVADWHALAATSFFPRLMTDGAICVTEAVPAGQEPAALPDGPPFELVLRHERIPFVSYPYEWTFSMLRDAALLHLDILLAALAERVTTKDGSAYNIQWRGAQPTFIDVGSFEVLREGEPWAGYRQFCQTMLYPLLLRAHLGVPFQPWLRAQIDGITAAQMRPLFTGRRRFAAGVLANVHLQAAMQRRFAGASAGGVRDELRAAGMSTELVVATVGKLRRLVHRLAAHPDRGHWSDYRQTCTYSDADRVAKTAFVHAALAGVTDLGQVLDLGANDGAYSQVAAQHARYVVAVEGDEATTDELYRRLRVAGERRVLPLVMDLADPSPGGGWRGVERAPFGGRVGADAVLALALVHHLAIGHNVPLPELVDWLAGLGPRVVVEFVDPTDPMARRLLANKPAGLFGDYRRDEFERLLQRRFRIERQEQLPSGTRTLYFGLRRD